MHMLRSNIQPVGDISHSEFFMLKVICKHSTPWPFDVQSQ